MELLIIAIVILIVVGMLIWVIRSSSIPNPFNWMLQLVIVLIGALIILYRTGVVA